MNKSGRLLQFWHQSKYPKTVLMLAALITRLQKRKYIYIYNITFYIKQNVTHFVQCTIKNEVKFHQTERKIFALKFHFVLTYQQ